MTAMTIPAEPSQHRGSSPGSVARDRKREPRRRTLLLVLRDASVVVVAAAVLALGSNSLRKDGLPLVARQDFETLVPCPEPMGTATAVAASDERLRNPASLLIDARSPEEYQEWHLPEALNFPFDWLAEQEEIDRQATKIAKTVARSGKQHVVVYGDGGDPDSGHHSATLLHGAGIKNVVYVSGGAAAVRTLPAFKGGAQ